MMIAMNATEGVAEGRDGGRGLLSVHRTANVIVGAVEPHLVDAQHLRTSIRFDSSLKPCGLMKRERKANANMATLSIL